MGLAIAKVLLELAWWPQGLVGISLVVAKVLLELAWWLLGSCCN